MTIYIFGANGMLGSYIKTFLISKNVDCVCITRNDLDASIVTYEKLDSLLSNRLKEGDVIINCIGIIPQSKQINDTNNRNYFLVNSMFPNMLSTVANQYKCRFIHVTTDCVFSGSKCNYIESDEHDETNDYGVSKSLGELGINATIIRTSIIGEEQKNKYSLLEWVKSHRNETINGYKNHFWNGVTCLQLAKIIYEMIHKNIWWNGVRHIFSPYVFSKYELVRTINDVYHLNNTINDFETENKIDKTLKTIYPTNEQFDIPDLKVQIQNLYEYIFIDNGYKFCYLKSSDKTEYINLLSQLSKMNIDVSDEAFNIFVAQLNNSHMVKVIKDGSDKIIGTITIFIENKIIHNNGKVGHIEDVVVDSEYRKKGIGKKLLEHAREICKDCYKIILNCDDDKIDFYTKCGFELHCNQMRMNLIN